MKRNKKLWSWALAGALAVSNLSVVAAPFSGIVAMAADNVVTWRDTTSEGFITGRTAIAEFTVKEAPSNTIVVTASETQYTATTLAAKTDIATFYGEPTPSTSENIYSATLTPESTFAAGDVSQPIYLQVWDATVVDGGSGVKTVTTPVLLGTKTITEYEFATARVTIDDEATTVYPGKEFTVTANGTLNAADTGLTNLQWAMLSKTEWEDAQSVIKGGTPGSGAYTNLLGTNFTMTTANTGKSVDKSYTESQTFKVETGTSAPVADTYYLIASEKAVTYDNASKIPSTNLVGAWECVVGDVEAKNYAIGTDVQSGAVVATGTMVLGDTLTLKEYDNLVEFSGSGTTEWISNSESKVTVENGVLTANKLSATGITITANYSNPATGAAASATFTVTSIAQPNFAVVQDGKATDPKGATTKDFTVQTNKSAPFNVSTYTGTSPSDKDLVDVTADATYVVHDNVSGFTTEGTKASEHASVTNGAFVADKAGFYTVVISYTAKAGETARVVKYNVEVEDAVLTIKPISTGTENPISGCYTGDEFLYRAFIGTDETTDVTWKSSDEKVAKVSNGSITAVGPGSAKIICTYGSGTSAQTANVTITVNNDKYEGQYKLSGDKDFSTPATAPALSVYVGSEAELKVLKNKKDTTDVASWESDNDKYVTVDDNGVIHAESVTSGATSIPVYAKDSKGKTIVAFAVQVDAIELNVRSDGNKIATSSSPANLDVNPGQKIQLSAYQGDEPFAGGEWTKAAGGAATLSISDDGLITVDAAAVTAETATFKYTYKSEVVQITATVAANSYKLALNSKTTAQITQTITLAPGATEQIKLTNNGEDVTNNAEISYLSADSTYVKVDPDSGEITAIKDTAAPVRIGIQKPIAGVNKVINHDGTDGTNLATTDMYISVTVTTIPVTGINIDPSSLDLTIGETGELTAVLSPAGAVADILWESDDSSIASVENGTVTAIAEGTTTISASVGTVKAICTVTVSKSEDAKAAEKAAADANAAAKAANDAAAAAQANPTADTVKAAQDAAAAANNAAAVAEAAAAKTDDADAKKAAEDAAAAAKAAAKTATDAAAAAQAEIDKKAAEEAAKKAADGSAAKTPAPVGTELKDANGKDTGFKVTDANPAAPEVEFVGPADKSAKSVDIPEVQKDLSGNEYKVTSIAPEAFKDSKAKTVTIRKNIKKIDPNAFKNSKVKNVKIKGTKLSKKMAKAFKKLKKGGKITCSGSNKKKNKKYLSALKNVKNGNTKLK